jgi:hypothetical protein
MKHSIIVVVGVVAVIQVLSCAAWADFVPADNIKHETWYVASSPLTLGAYTSTHPHAGAAGFTVTSPFQINLEYQAGVMDADIANLNTYLFPANAAYPANHHNGTWALNYTDCEEYILSIDASGSVPIYTMGETTPVIDPSVQWTLTSWGQTLLAGDIVAQGSGVFLRVQPTGMYRPFDGDLHVNDAEVFHGNVACEVLGYTFNGPVGEIGAGANLDPVLTPEPATLALLAAGGGLALVRRIRRRK